MTTSKALTWAEGLAKQIPSFIEPGGNAQQIAFQTKFWEKEIKVAQRLAMKNADDVLALNTVDPITTIWVEQQKLSKTMAGDPMWKQISKDAINNIFGARKKLTAYKEKLAKAQEACFIAGTLVHTDKGLVPIEKLQVGDLVLSQPENKGPLSYKPITRTFVHEEQEVLAIHFTKIFDADTLPPGGVSRNYFSEWIVATPNHPFYTLANEYQFSTDGWYPASQFVSGRVELKDGTHAGASWAKPLFATGVPNQAWFALEPRKDWYGEGRLLDLSTGTVTANRHYNAPGHREDVPLLKRTVYNIEVQDNHTYYVGQLGMWVHNKNPNGT